MSDLVPRLRMFAGPNGSGKSTLKRFLSPALLGIYMNPDEIEQEIRDCGCLDLANYGVTATSSELRQHFEQSPLLRATARDHFIDRIGFEEGLIDFTNVVIDSYLASATVDIIRRQLMSGKRSFTFETVMSHRSKVDILKRAQASGFRTYLYYIATDDPTINIISRVRNRVKMGGHSVPEDKHRIAVLPLVGSFN